MWLAGWLCFRRAAPGTAAASAVAASEPATQESLALAHQVARALANHGVPGGEEATATADAGAKHPRNSKLHAGCTKCHVYLFMVPGGPASIHMWQLQ